MHSFHQNICKALIAALPLSLLAQEAPGSAIETIDTETVISTPSPLLVPALEPLAYLGDQVPASPIQIPSLESGEPTLLLVKSTKSPGIAALLSGLTPGLGHYYLGQSKVGSALLGATLLGSATAYATSSDPSLSATSLYATQGIYMYSIYAAYRDANLYNGNAAAFLPRDDLKSLSAAPFQWSVIKKPEVWGACVGALALGVTTAYFAFPQDVQARVKTTYIEPLSALPIAVGEESLFRGFLQTALVESLSPWGAITVSSLVFGAAHIPNAQGLEESQRWRYYTFSLPIITGFGAYMGWLTYKNHSLKESVALHAWYDFTLMCAGAFASKAAIGGPTQISHAWDF